MMSAPTLRNTASSKRAGARVYSHDRARGILSSTITTSGTRAITGDTPDLAGGRKTGAQPGTTGAGSPRSSSTPGIVSSRSSGTRQGPPARVDVERVDGAVWTLRNRKGVRL